MCLIRIKKSLKELENSPNFGKTFGNDETQRKSNFEQKDISFFQNLNLMQENEILVSPILFNNLIINSLSMKLDYACQMLDQVLEQIQDVIQSQKKTELKYNATQNQQNVVQQFFQTHQPLVRQIFGEKAYKYSLKLIQKIPSTLYKERNFQIKVFLKDSQNKKISNCNNLNLAIGVCDIKGNWVMFDNDYFIKGKVEVEIINGEADFVKIHAKDISRRLPKGKLNFVIYAKPSLLEYSGDESKRFIDSDEIQPLILKNIVVLSKKK